MLYRNLITKPIVELGHFSEFYLDYFESIALEQLASIAITANSQTLFGYAAMGGAMSRVATYSNSSQLGFS
jgi:hypothetical protein